MGDVGVSITLHYREECNTVINRRRANRVYHYVHDVWGGFVSQYVQISRRVTVAWI